MPPEDERVDRAGGWQQGQVLSDRYRVEGWLHRSSTCYLYRVKDVFRNLSHLVLCPSPETLAEEGGAEWFRRFARAALAVPFHPNLLPCRRLDHDGQTPYLIMDDTGGERWSTAIRKVHLRELRGMLSAAIQAAHALAWLHANDTIHRNLKPANAFLTEAGVLRIFKYGESVALTRAYASPEQVAGTPVLTRTTDIWSWAACVLHMFVGMVNWTHGNSAPEALETYIENGPATPELSLMPVPVVELLRRCFAQEPQDRPADMMKIIAVMEGVYRDATNERFRLPAEAYESQATASELDESDAGPPGKPSGPPAQESVDQSPTARPPERKRFSPNRKEGGTPPRRRPGR